MVAEKKPMGVIARVGGGFNRTRLSNVKLLKAAGIIGNNGVYPAPGESVPGKTIRTLALIGSKYVIVTVNVYVTATSSLN